MSALSSTTSCCTALSTTFLTRCANCSRACQPGLVRGLGGRERRTFSVDLVSSMAAGDGFIVAMTATRASPDSDGWRICVSLESR